MLCGMMGSEFFLLLHRAVGDGRFTAAPNPELLLLWYSYISPPTLSNNDNANETMITPTLRYPKEAGQSSCLAILLHEVPLRRCDPTPELMTTAALHSKVPPFSISRVREGTWRVTRGCRFFDRWHRWGCGWADGFSYIIIRKGS